MGVESKDTGSDFPTPIKLRVMGKAREDFSEIVLETIRKHIPDIDQSAIKIRPSRQGKYVSVNVSFQVRSKEQFSAIYQDLQGNELILMVL